jgi:hypothetical protein
VREITVSAAFPRPFSVADNARFVRLGRLQLHTVSASSGALRMGQLPPRSPTAGSTGGKRAERSGARLPLSALFALHELSTSSDVRPCSSPPRTWVAISAPPTGQAPAKDQAVASSSPRAVCSRRSRGQDLFDIGDHAPYEAGVVSELAVAPVRELHRQ